MRQINETVLAIIIALFLTQVNLSAQPPQGHSPPPIPDSAQIVKLVNHMAHELLLSKKQKQEITALHFKHFKQVQAMHSNDGQAKVQSRQKHENLRSQLESDIKAILSDDQFDEYLKFIEEHRHRRKPIEKD